MLLTGIICMRQIALRIPLNICPETLQRQALTSAPRRRHGLLARARPREQRRRFRRRPLLLLLLRRRRRRGRRGAHRGFYAVAAVQLGEAVTEAGYQPGVARPQGRDGGGGHAEEDFPAAPVPVRDTLPGGIGGLVLAVEDGADDGEGAGDDAEAHEEAEADFVAEADLDSAEDEDGEDGEEEV